MKKYSEFTCPKCGNYLENNLSDIEANADDILLTYTCSECGEVWTEEYKLDYRGYRYRDKYYDDEGDEY